MEDEGVRCVEEHKEQKLDVVTLDFWLLGDLLVLLTLIPPRVDSKVWNIGNVGQILEIQSCEEVRAMVAACSGCAREWDRTGTARL